MARLLGIRIKNYKSFADIKLGQTDYGKGEPLPSFVCFIGPNGSGKSTLLDAFGFVSDCLLEGVEGACDKPARGGFERLRTQGSTGPITFEIFFEHDDPDRPIVYKLQIDLIDGVPSAVKETLRQRRRGETRGQPYYFLNLTRGRGRVWAGDRVGAAKDVKASKSVRLADLNQLGLATLGNLADHPRIVALRSYVEQWYLSYFVPDAARELPPSGAQKWLDRKGSNVGNVLQYLERTYSKPNFQKIIDRVTRAIPGLKNIKCEPSADKRLLIRFDEAGYMDPFYQQSMSDGTLKMLAYAVLLSDPQPRPFIGIEEPENGLYIDLIEHLARQFVSHSSNKDRPTQILVTTHSSYFVDALGPDQVWIIRKGIDGHAAATRVADLPNVRELTFQGVPLGAQWYSDHFGTEEIPSLEQLENPKTTRASAQ
ncbi:AAA family ATPase [Geothrix sp. PMB-07]|uniref:AAA family ATPase n=1 Tax=Geothrix sp. PMB-07 TaxID=3068640 RepID=UPI0027416790|nr:AAA family ATPase [Geothrix sp. PMB-07]WLT30642.1 AAA family ATPase [Geothrix sp. PMB-07]